MASKRKQQIQAILNDLAAYEPRDGEQYAVAENIAFFQAAKNPLIYLHWQLFRAPKIDDPRLLELADLPLRHWREIMYEQLNSVERKKFPGLLKPLRNYLCNISGSVYLDIGCGNMEVERQMILSFERNSAKPKIFVGMDLSPEAYLMIKRNFQEHTDKVEIKKMTVFDKKSFEAFRNWQGPKHLILFVQENALELRTDAPWADVDVVYSSKFKHHLTAEQQSKFDGIIKGAGCHAVEFDDFRTAVSWIPMALTAWSKPVLFNGALFSRLRQPSKRDLKKEAAQSKIVFFSPPGSYIKILRH